MSMTSIIPALLSLLLAAASPARTPEAVPDTTAAYDPDTHHLRISAAASGAYAAELRGLSFYPYQSAVPDPDIPVAFLTGPNPYSSPETLLLVTAPSDFAFEVLSHDHELRAVLEFENVAPGPYSAHIAIPGFEHERIEVRLLYQDEVVGEARLYVR